MKKFFLLFLIIIFASFVYANVCCNEGCYPNTQDGYALKCCNDPADPNKGTAYLGCKGSDLNSYCLNDVWEDCLECQYNTIEGYHWVDAADSLCPVCKHSCEKTFDAENRPLTAKCIFEIDLVLNIQYKCTLGTSQCLVPQQVEEHQQLGGYYCCGLQPGTTDTYITGTQNLDNNFFTDSDTNQQYSGVYEKGIDERFVDKDGLGTYNQVEEVIDEGATGGIQTPGGTPLTFPVPDICDIETTPADCTDGIDNDGDGSCDVGGCTKCDVDGCYGIPAEADSDCATEYCANCGSLPFCWKEKCKGGFYRPSTGFGSCTFKGAFGPCCDDSDGDGICDSDDNSPDIPNGPDKGTCTEGDAGKIGNTCTSNGQCGTSEPLNCDTGQGDADGDGIGDVSDPCPTIRQSESILSSDNTRLCTGTEEKLCSTNNYEIVNVGEDFFCNGNIWINKNQCEYAECFYVEEEGTEKFYYWIDNKDKICDLTNKQLIETDTNAAVCELLEPETQGSCEEGETGCWDIDASGANTKCCGDDGNGDTWIDSKNNACANGVFYTDPDDLPTPDLCEIVTGYQDTCTHGYVCWFNDKCCGDDANEIWTHSTSDKIDDILVDASCYNGKWFVRTNARVTYYEIST